MNKIVFIIVALIIVVGYIFEKDKFLKENFTLVNVVKEKYTEYVFSVEEFFNKYFQQAKQIENLTKKNEELVKFQSLYMSKKEENEDILESNLSVSKIDETIELVKVLSYVNLNDFTAVWLDKKKSDEVIEGLIDGEFSAGIVVNKSGYAQALLNGNEKSNYAVFVGENRAPGITHQNQNSEFLTVRYIPIWIDIKVGDEVITSGMDSIFFEGLKVGKVVSIKKMADLQEATIKPYSNVLRKKFFHTYSKKQDIEIEMESTPLVESEPD